MCPLILTVINGDYNGGGTIIPIKDGKYKGEYPKQNPKP